MGNPPLDHRSDDSTAVSDLYHTLALASTAYLQKCRIASWTTKDTRHVQHLSKTLCRCLKNVSNRTGAVAGEQKQKKLLPVFPYGTRSALEWLGPPTCLFSHVASLRGPALDAPLDASGCLTVLEHLAEVINALSGALSLSSAYKAAAHGGKKRGHQPEAARFFRRIALPLLIVIEAAVVQEDASALGQLIDLASLTVPYLDSTSAPELLPPAPPEMDRLQFSFSAIYIQCFSRLARHIADGQLFFDALHNNDAPGTSPRGHDSESSPRAAPKSQKLFGRRLIGHKALFSKSVHGLLLLLRVIQENRPTVLKVHSQEEDLLSFVYPGLVSMVGELIVTRSARRLGGLSLCLEILHLLILAKMGSSGKGPNCRDLHSTPEVLHTLLQQAGAPVGSKNEPTKKEVSSLPRDVENTCHTLNAVLDVLILDLSESILALHNEQNADVSGTAALDPTVEAMIRCGDNIARLCFAVLSDCAGTVLPPLNARPNADDTSDLRSTCYRKVLQALLCSLPHTTEGSGSLYGIPNNVEVMRDLSQIFLDNCQGLSTPLQTDSTPPLRNIQKVRLASLLGYLHLRPSHSSLHSGTSKEFIQRVAHQLVPLFQLDLRLCQPYLLDTQFCCTERLRLWVETVPSVVPLLRDVDCGSDTHRRHDAAVAALEKRLTGALESPDSEDPMIERAPLPQGFPERCAVLDEVLEILRRTSLLVSANALASRTFLHCVGGRLSSYFPDFWSQIACFADLSDRLMLKEETLSTTTPASRSLPAWARPWRSTGVPGPLDLTLLPFPCEQLSERVALIHLMVAVLAVTRSTTSETSSRVPTTPAPLPPEGVTTFWNLLQCFTTALEYGGFWVDNVEALALSLMSDKRKLFSLKERECIALVHTLDVTLMTLLTLLIRNFCSQQFPSESRIPPLSQHQKTEATDELRDIHAQIIHRLTLFSYNVLRKAGSPYRLVSRSAHLLMRELAFFCFLSDPTTSTSLSIKEASLGAVSIQPALPAFGYQEVVCFPPTLGASLLDAIALELQDACSAALRSLGTSCPAGLEQERHNATAALLLAAVTIADDLSILRMRDIVDILTADYLHLHLLKRQRSTTTPVWVLRAQAAIAKRLSCVVASALQVVSPCDAPAISTDDVCKHTDRPNNGAAKDLGYLSPGVMMAAALLKSASKHLFDANLEVQFLAHLTCLYALHCVSISRDVCLPLIHQVWPALKASLCRQAKSQALHPLTPATSSVRLVAALILSFLVRSHPTFLSSRFQSELFPILSSLLKSCPCWTRENSNDTHHPHDAASPNAPNTQATRPSRLRTHQALLSVLLSAAQDPQLVAPLVKRCVGLCLPCLSSTTPPVLQDLALRLALRCAVSNLESTALILCAFGSLILSRGFFDESGSPLRSLHETICALIDSPMSPDEAQTVLTWASGLCIQDFDAMGVPHAAASPHATLGIPAPPAVLLQSLICVESPERNTAKEDAVRKIEVISSMRFSNKEHSRASSSRLCLLYVPNLQRLLECIHSEMIEPIADVPKAVTQESSKTD